MEREKLVSEIQSRLGQTCVSPQTIGSVIDFQPLPEGTEPDEAYYDRVKKLLSSFDGNINHYMAEQTRARDAQIAELKAKLQTQDPHEPKEPVKTPPADDRLQALLDRLDKIEAANKTLNEQLDGFKNKQTEEHLMSEVSTKLRDKCSNKNLLDLAMQTYGAVDTSKSADEIAEEVEKNYNALAKKLFGNGVLPGGGMQETKPINTAQAKAKQEQFRTDLVKSGKLPKRES